MNRVRLMQRLLDGALPWAAPWPLLCGACSSGGEVVGADLGENAGQTWVSEGRDSEFAISSTASPADDIQRESATYGSDERKRPTAGAPYYIHFGRYGLCIDHGQWDQLPDAGGIYFDEKSGLLTIGQGSAWRSELRMFADTKGTSNWYDDTVEIELSLAYEGVPGPPTVITESLPYYAPPSGGIGSYTTSTEPQKLNVLKAEFRSSGDEDRRASVVNDTRIPMRASGHLLRPWDGAANGFYGGSAPDCVLGSNYDDVIRGRGGADHIRGKYGDDFLSGGEGDDTLEGGDGDDILDGGGGVDQLEDGNGRDCFRGGLDGLRDVLIANTYFADDEPVYQPEPGIVDGLPVDNIEHLYGDKLFPADVCP